MKAAKSDTKRCVGEMTINELNDICLVPMSDADCFQCRMHNNCPMESAMDFQFYDWSEVFIPWTFGND
jgi:hypothetical protein